MWKGLVPLLVDDQEEEQQLSTTSMKQVALKELVQHFSDHIRRFNFNHTNCSDDTDIDDENQCDRCDWMTVHIKTVVNDDCGNFIPVDTTSDQNTQHYLSIVILPPNPLYNKKCITYSRIPSTSPTSLFSGRLIYEENTLIRLTSLSAYISTMGGGFFLCRYLSTAVSMARQQCRIALIRGDEEMAFKCRINEGYCYIHAGKLKRGKKIIKCVLYDVAKRQKQKYGLDWEVSMEHEESELAHSSYGELNELMVIRNMCTSALRFANLIKQQKLKEAAAAAGDETENNKLSVSVTHDDFQRIRVVKDRIWKQ